MTTLDRVMQLQQQGKTDAEIMATLQNERISPSEINNALAQAKVKTAVSAPEPSNIQTPEIQTPPTTPTQDPALPQMPEPMQTPAPAPAPAPTQQTYQEQQPQEDYYTPQPQAYSEQDYYPGQESYGADNMSEIAEQVATEKLEDYKATVGDVASFKNQIQNQVNNIDDRLKRIEDSIAQLQQSILGKIGEYGENYAMVHKDLNNLHGTVANLMNPLIDNINEMKKLNKK